MKTLDTLYQEIGESESLKAQFAAAVKENKLGDFLGSQNCDATVEQAMEFLKEKQSKEGMLEDEELDSVAGGCGSDSSSCSRGYLIM